jgi:TrmH family RNA methyltransferase
VALLKRRERERTGLMRVEGWAELRLALESGARPATLLYCPELFRRPSEVGLLQRVERAGAELIEVSPALFKQVTHRPTPDGWLAVFPAIRRKLRSLALGANALVLVAEGLEKPGNLGALLRTADAAGAGAVISASPRVDLGHPDVGHASRGALFSVPVCEAPSEDALRWLRERCLRIVAATPEASLRYDEAELRGPVALAVGRESRGVSALWLDAADVRVRIPMLGQVDSLNVAVAAALLLYEAARQREEGRAAPLQGAGR